MLKLYLPAVIEIADDVNLQINKIERFFLITGTKLASKRIKTEQIPKNGVAKTR